ncbi:hypothetical protein [Legionella brunensis]|uniref:Transmembrane protein n=1 Tax=Legionella brunensis TaxID=29422 RepID=A0A0W0SKU2_9GAMM|nr:hypothetical protein [Legionella brunensis]KTC83833.1 hypothetical protein Lbru_1656 [Legionella brunensis]
MTSKLIELAQTNYSFLLKCMAALATAAVITLGIIAALTMKTTAALAPAIMASTATGAVGITAFTAAPLLPIAALLICIGAVCLLPFCVGSPRSTGYRYYSNNYDTWYTPSFYSGSHTHAHAHGGPHHYHGSDGHHHSHDPYSGGHHHSHDSGQYHSDTHHRHH